jgi:hypothetical protein
MKHVIAKLGTMRKSKSWIVYPTTDSQTSLKIQCDDRIAMIDPQTGKGLLSKSTTFPGFIYLHPGMGAKPIEVTKELVNEIIAAMPKPGEEIGPGVYLAPEDPPLDRLAAI